MWTPSQTISRSTAGNRCLERPKQHCKADESLHAVSGLFLYQRRITLLHKCKQKHLQRFFALISWTTCGLAVLPYNGFESLPHQKREPWRALFFGAGNRTRTCTRRQWNLNPPSLPIPPCPQICLSQQGYPNTKRAVCQCRLAARRRAKLLFWNTPQGPSCR